MKISKGHLHAFFAYLLWGVFPIYWKYLKSVSAAEILCHRIIGSFVFLGVLAFAFKKSSMRQMGQALKSQFADVALLAFFIASNWIIYIYAVNIGQILQGSLAYFMTPLLNIVLGALIFKEKLSKAMAFAASIAGVGVLSLALLNTHFPWIAVSLALTFSFYGVLKKKTRLGGLESSFLENGILVVPALLGASYLRSHAETPLSSDALLLLMGSGLITAIPILLFSLAARAIPFHHIGVLQFMAPSMQFVVGHWLYGEPVSERKFFAFICVWLGACLYLREIFKQGRIKSHS